MTITKEANEAMLNGIKGLFKLDAPILDPPKLAGIELYVEQ